MQKKIIIILVVVLLFSFSSIAAATPSVFEIGLINYYSLDDFVEKDFANYTPAVRATLYVNNWFGLSGDAILRAPFGDSATTKEFNLILAGDLVFRWPTKLIEPYIAFGPAYDLVISETKVELPETIRFGARLGLDFNITPLLSVGVEANHIASNLSAVVAGEEYDFIGDTFVGISIKLKL